METIRPEEQPARGKTGKEAQEGSRSKGRGWSFLLDPVPWLTLAVIFAFDQLTKWAVIENLAYGESVPADGFFRFTHVWNTGTAFGLFQGQGDILAVVSLLAVVLLVFVYRSAGQESNMVRVAFGLQLGGAFGNLFDRFRLGHVTDFINVGPWPVFNIADSAIVIGIGVMVFYFWNLKDRDEHAQSADADAPGSERAGHDIGEPSDSAHGEHGEAQDDKAGPSADGQPPDPQASRIAEDDAPAPDRRP
ncbi:MAG: signal peptidase II [Dehalococcoidia bacterium]